MLNPYLFYSCCIYPFLLVTYSSCKFFSIPIPHTLNSLSKIDLETFVIQNLDSLL